MKHHNITAAVALITVDFSAFHNIVTLTHWRRSEPRNASTRPHQQLEARALEPHWSREEQAAADDSCDSRSASSARTLGALVPFGRDTSKLPTVFLPLPTASWRLQAYPLLVTYRLAYCNQWVTQTLLGKAVFLTATNLRPGRYGTLSGCTCKIWLNVHAGLVGLNVWVGH